MTFIHSIAAKFEVVLPRNVSALNVLSLLLFGIALLLPMISSLVVLVLGMLIQASFFRVLHREKAGIQKLVKRLVFIVGSSAAIFIILFQNHLL